MRIVAARLDLWKAILAISILAWSAFAQTNSFRFAFLSDIHIGSATAEEDLRATVRDINSLTVLSFVVLSGDVTEYGSLEQLRLAKQILDELKIPCHVVPGNHDTKWSESGATDFPRLWGNDRFEFEQGGFRFIGLHQSPLMKMGDGHWSPEDVRWLAETLRNMPDQNQPIVFITHYPLNDGIANWFVVLDLLKRYNTQVVLCRHGHSNRKLDFEGLPSVMGRSNLRGRKEVGGYNLVEVSDGTMTFSGRAPARETKPPWHTVNLHKHDFTDDTNEYPRPDFSVNKRYPKANVRWQFETGYTIASTSAVWHNSAIVGDASGTLYAFNLKSGRLQWRFKTENAVYSSPEVANGLFVFASTDGCIYALKAATGEGAWKLKTARPIVASPRIADSVVFVGSSDGVFRAINLNDGKLHWQVDGVTGFVETKPLVHEGKVIFGAWDGHLYALDQKTGALAWKWKGDKPRALYSPAACWPVAANGKVFVVAPDRKMTAIDVQTGKQIWRTGDYMVRESIGISLDHSRFYVRAMQDSIYAFSTAADAPEKLWECEAGFKYDINSAMLIEKEGVLFYGTKNGLLVARDARSGVLKWQHKLGVGILNTVVPLRAREVLTTDFDGKVTLVAVDD